MPEKILATENNSNNIKHSKNIVITLKQGVKFLNKLPIQNPNEFLFQRINIR